MSRVVAVALFVCFILFPRPAAATSYAIERLSFEGSEGKQDEIEELLPRPLPTTLTDAEITELTRRIKNLALFDLVEVNPRGPILEIKVRRKFVITPIVDFSTGKTLADTSGTIGAIHNDIDGHASRLSVELGYEERSPRFSIGFYEHPYRPRSWQNEYEAYYAGSSFRFDDPHAGSKWLRNRLGGEIEFLSPSSYGHRFRYELQLNVYRELLTRVESGFAPPDGTFVGVTSELIYDRYTWNDLTPNGFRAALEIRPGVFIGPAQPRHEVRAKVIGGIKLGAKTVLAFFTLADALNGGNPNHSVLIGSQEGVRGLPDALYRNRMGAYANLELRHAVEIRPRWYVQGAVFADAAVFEPMDPTGRPLPWQGAIATGAGLRLLPTALVDTLLRADVSRLHAPFETWFLQFGISQYF